MRISRRTLLGTISTFPLLYSTPTTLLAQVENFDQAFSALQRNESLLETIKMAGLERETAVQARGTVNSRKRDTTRELSPKALKLIVTFEVSSESVYEKKYRGVIKPGGASGPTIGIGYDLGYVTEKIFREDWQAYLSEADLLKLSSACGKTKTAATAILGQLSGISIPFDVAHEQFLKNVVPVYMAATTGALANTGELSDDSLGALVSLVYNRGPSFTKTGKRYRHMRNIKNHMTHKQYQNISKEFEEMKVLWQAPDVIGVATRRHLEALLFEEGRA
ncbi:hypothetical protein [Pararhizobium sp. PWRC1-1]|uniref:hypothetical protein n=1 Tax=Pararhizobium sp. PWRC1-1 TaxID=2804566 RepID=UPI003CED3A92